MPFIYGTSSNYQTFADALHDVATGTSLHSVDAVATAGSGYVVGDELTLSGGTSTIAAIVEVTEVGGSGEVVAVRIRNAGLYSVAPTSPVAVTGGTGTGAELTCTFDTNGWSALRATNVGGTGHREIILEGVGSGTDEIIVGFLTYSDSGSGARNLELAGMTGFNSGLAWADQPGISPGRNTATSGGCYVPLASTTITWWISVTPRRILFCSKIGTYYGSGYVGLLNPYATEGEWTYPLYIAGSTSNRFHLPSTTSLNNSGITDPNAISPTGNGPALVRLASGSWQAIWNALSSTTSTRGTVVYPKGRMSFPVFESGDDWYSESLAWDQFMPSSSESIQTNRLIRTEDSGGDIFILVPCVVVQATTSGSPLAILGEIDGVYVFEANGEVVPENRFVQNGVAYTAFQEGSRTANWMRWAMKES